MIEELELLTNQMEFTPIIPDTINTMDSRIFQEGHMGINKRRNIEKGEVI